jgi:hypothetical protein
MKFTSNEQILICIIIGMSIIIFLLYNKSEGFATNTEAVNNTNINGTSINVTDSSGNNYFKTFNLGYGPVTQFNGQIAATNINANNINGTSINVTDSSGNNYFKTFNLGYGPVTQFNGQIAATNINANNINASGDVTAKRFISTDGSSSSEAIQNIASVYNNNNLKVTNISATGGLSAGSVNTGKLYSSDIVVTDPAGKIYFQTYNPGNGNIVQFRDSNIAANDVGCYNLNAGGAITASGAITGNDLISRGSISTIDLNASGAIKATGINISNSAGNNYFKTFDIGQGPTVQVNATLSTNRINASELWVNGRKIA